MTNLQSADELLREWLNNETDSGGVSALAPKIENIDTLVTAVALALVELQEANALVPATFDDILVTYTDATKAVILKVEWKLSGGVVQTYTPTFGATTDDWVIT